MDLTFSKIMTSNPILSTLAKAKPCDDGDCVCIDIENRSADVTLVFMKPMSLPSLEQIGVLIKDLVELDEFIACRDRSREYYAETGYELEFSSVEVANSDAITMYYCGVGVNVQWGADFSKNKSGQWVFGGLC